MGVGCLQGTSSSIIKEEEIILPEEVTKEMPSSIPLSTIISQNSKLLKDLNENILNISSPGPIFRKLIRRKIKQ